jgi:hypothetical protein
VPICRDEPDTVTMGGRATLAMRAQATVTDLACHRLIRLVEPQPDELVEQGRGPQMRVLAQSCGHVLDEPFEQNITIASADPSDAITSEIRTDRLAITAQMRRDRGDRPAPRSQRVYIQVFLLCEHRVGAPSNAWWWSETASIQGAPPQTVEPNRWGISVSSYGEIHTSVIKLRRANTILKSASAFFAAELDRPQR